MSIKKDEKLNEKAKDYMAKGQYEKAIEILEKIQEAEVLHKKYVNLGCCYHSLKKYNKAIECYNKAIQTERRDYYGGVYNNLGNIYYDLGERETALLFLKQAFLSDNKDAIIIYNLAHQYYELGEIDKTFYVLSFFDEKNSNSKKHKLYKGKEKDAMYEFLGDVYGNEKNDYKKAVKYYLNIKNVDIDLLEKILKTILKLGFPNLFIHFPKMLFFETKSFIVFLGSAFAYLCMFFYLAFHIAKLIIKTYIFNDLSDIRKYRKGKNEKR